MSSTRMSWYHLPCELRQTILHVLIEEETRSSGYAPVCREWQRAIEKTTFRRLNLTPSCLRDLDKIARSRSPMLRCINFSVELRPLVCSYCLYNCNTLDIEPDTKMVADTIRRLFSVLSTWESSSQGLTLDMTLLPYLHAHSENRNCIFHDTRNLPCRDFPPGHAHRDGRNSRPILAPMGQIPCTNSIGEFLVELPQVTAVTALRVRRQIRLDLDIYSIHRILSRLPMVQTIHYEPWLNENDMRHRHSRLLRSLHLHQINKIVVFDWDEYAGPLPVRHDQPFTPGEAEQFHRDESRIGQGLARTSLRLESLSVSFAADAKYFFDQCSATWTWTKLESLALTSRVLHPSDRHDVETNKLLQTAAVAATRMPRLNRLVIWNHEAHEALGAFIFEASAAERWSRVTWRATWDMSLQPAVIQSWTALALKRTCSELSVVKDFIHPGSDFHTFSEAALRLRLPCELLHPDSRRL